MLPTDLQCSDELQSEFEIRPVSEKEQPPRAPRIQGARKRGRIQALLFVHETAILFYQFGDILQRLW